MHVSFNAFKDPKVLIVQALLTGYGVLVTHMRVMRAPKTYTKANPLQIINECSYSSCNLNTKGFKRLELLGDSRACQ